MPVPWKTDLVSMGSVPFGAGAVEPCRIPETQDRAVTLRQLRSLGTYVKRLCKTGILQRESVTEAQHEDADRRIFWFDINQYDVNELVIKKIIPKEQSCSWVELVADRPENEDGTAAPRQPPDTHLSHAWGESFRDFMVSIEHHARDKRVGPDHTYWHCLCANNQWNLTEELGSTLETSPFYQALQDSQETLLLLDRDGIVMRRAWCLFEWYHTIVKLKRPESLGVSTCMGLVGSSMVSSGIYVDLLNSMDCMESQASDPSDLRRIQNSIAGENQTADIDLIVLIESTNDKGNVVTKGAHNLSDNDTVVYQVGVGEPLLDTSGHAVKDKSEFRVKVVSPTEMCLKSLSDHRLRRVQGGQGANLLTNEYEKKYSEWIQHNRDKFHAVDELVRKHTLIGCRESFISKHSRGSMASPAFRAITLAQLRNFAETVKKRFREEKWDYAGFETLRSDNRERFGHDGPGEHVFTKLFRGDGAIEWKDITWYHLKHLIILRQLGTRDCSFVETITEKAVRGQYHFSFPWDVPFQQFVNGVEWLVEARQMADTTPFLMYPLTLAIKTRREYYDSNLWEVCMDSCESSVLFEGKFSSSHADLQFQWKAGPLLDLHNAISRNKSVDLICRSGALALHRPFAAGSWEFGRFDVAGALACVKLDVSKLESHHQGFVDQLRGTGTQALYNLHRTLRTAGAGPVLRDAAYRDDAELVQFVQSSCPWLTLQSPRLQGPLGETPLHIAASAGNTKVLSLLLKLGANVNAMDFDGETSLHYAALSGQESAAKILLKANADPRQQSFFSETPLEVALQQPAYFLIDYNPIQTVLCSWSSENSSWNQWDSSF